MRIEFTKMQGCGNDYIYVDCTKRALEEPERVSALLSPRHYAVGSDGLVLICPSLRCDFRMRMFNLDGSEGKMCGNAIRCVGKYVYDHAMTDKTELTVETASGDKHLRLRVEGGRVREVTVDMGIASTEPSSLPMLSDAPMIDAPTEVGGMSCRITAVSMGNPHQVIFCDDPSALALEKLGPAFEHSPLFPERVNTEFVRILDRGRFRMRVWERGSGETYACGTGACAAAVAAVLNGHCDYDRPITAELVGGELTLTVGRDLRVQMTGPAVKVYDGVYDDEE